MFELMQTARAIAIGCISAATLLGFSATAAADPTDTDASNEKLAGLIPPGSGDCQVSKQYPEDPFLARLGCGQRSQPGGPHGATYSLYGSPADVDTTFGRLAGSGNPVPCPGAAGPEPVSWGGGMVVCTTAAARSRARRLCRGPRPRICLSGSAMGNDLAALYTWWVAAR